MGALPSVAGSAGRTVTILTMPARKVEILRETARTHRLTTMIETGLWNGRGSGMALRDDGTIATYYALDIQPDNCALGKRECPAATIVCGDSRWTLPTVLSQLAGPALIWLDAHWLEPTEGFTTCPLLWELACIPNHHTVLIDDIRLMGWPGYPTLTELHKFAARWNVQVFEDIMRLTPPSP